MKFLIRFALSVFLLFATIPCAFCAEDYYTGWNYQHILSDIYDNVYIDGDSARINNNGIINGDIYIFDYINLEFQNSGEFNGTIYHSENSVLTQIIESNNDINQLNVNNTNNNFAIRIDGNDINFSDVLSIAGNANKIEIMNGSSLRLDLPQSNTIDLYIDSITLDLANLDLGDRTEIILLSRVIEFGGIFAIENLELPTLENARIEWINGNLVLIIEREVSSDKVIRELTPGQKEILRSSPQWPEIKRKIENGELSNEEFEKIIEGIKRGSSGSADGNGIINKAVGRSPIILMNMMRVKSLYSDVMAGKGGFNTLGFGIFNYDSKLYGGRISLGEDFGKLYLGLGFDGGVINGNNDINYTGNFYGAFVNGKYNGKYLNVGFNTGVDIANFKTNSMYFASDKMDGIAIHSGLGIELKLYDDGFYIHPKISGNYWHGFIENSDTSDIRFGGGSKIGYHSDVNGIKSDFYVYGSLENSGYNAGVGFEFFSVGDAIGANAKFDVIKFEDNIYFGTTIGLRFGF